MAAYCPITRPSDWREPEPDLEWRRAQKPRTDVQRKLVLFDEMVAKAFVSARTATADHSLEQRFLEHANKWERETGYLSSVTKRVMHPSYQAIIGMGGDVVPFLLRDLQQNRRDWFWALTAITQVNPISPEDAGKVEQMAKAWLNWGKEKGLL
jgi:hypothetical protein